MRTITKITALTATVAATALFAGTQYQNATAPYDTDVGYHITTFDVPHRDAPVELHVWYPTDAENAPVEIGSNILFHGFTAQIDAVATRTSAPLIVMSHGSGGNAAQMGWFATQMAAQGYIVAAPNHHATMSRDSDPYQTPMIWLRNQDLSAVIDTFAAGAVHDVAADMDQVAIAGFSLGGGAALSVSGAGLSKADFIEYCNRSDVPADCEWMLAAGVDFTQIDQDKYEADWTDPRIMATFAVDPALTQAMTVATLADIDHPVMTIGLGSQADIPLAVDASHLTTKMSDARHTWVEGAAHFSFLPTCGWIGKIATSVAGDDNICSDWGLRNRDAVHADLVEAAQGYFADVFETAPASDQVIAANN